MSRNEDVTTGIWVELMDLSSHAKLLYVWSFTNEHNNMAGLYKIHPAIIGVETNLDADEIQGAFAELEEAEFAFYEDGVLFVRSRVKRLRSRTVQIAKSVARAVAQIRPEHPLRCRFLNVYGRERWLSEAFSDAKLVNLTRTSPEVHENTDKQGGSVNLTRTSGEVPWSGQGLEEESGSVERQRLRREVSELFAYWQQRCGHSHAKLTPERSRAVVARLKQGYTVEQIRQAIDGAAVGAHVNEQGKKFDDLELICRNGAKLESFMERAHVNGGVESSQAFLARRGAA